MLTPKSLLRHPLVASTPRELAEGRFRMVLPDDEAAARAADVRRVLVCTGKVYVDLVAREQRAARPDVAICRVEQLYPVPMRDLRAMLDAYPNADEIVWVQEEPENMGAWDFIRPHLVEVVRRPHGAPRRPAAQRQPGGRLGRAPRAQPAGARRAGVRRSRARSRRSAAGAEPTRETSGGPADSAAVPDAVTQIAASTDSRASGN